MNASSPASEKVPVRCPSCRKAYTVPPERPPEQSSCPGCKVPLSHFVSGYRIERKLGAGGMGDVYLAHQDSLGRSIALKILPAHLSRDPRYVKRFLTEARNAGRVRHQNIVEVVDAGEAGGRPYFVMEYVEGETFQNLIRREGPLPETRALEIVRQIASGLREAHQQGLIHRDIKPANIILTGNGTAKICDFGLARDLKSDITLTQDGAVHSSPAYASPEQGRGARDLDHRTDMYSLGVTLFEALTRKLPFDGDTPGAILVKHVTESPPAPRSLNPALSSSINQFVLRLLRKQPAGRFGSYDELIETLDGVGRERTGKVPRRATAPLRTSRRSSTALRVGGAIAGVILLVVIAALASGGGKSRKAPAASTPPTVSPTPRRDPDVRRLLDEIGRLENEADGKPSRVPEVMKRLGELERRYRKTEHHRIFNSRLAAFRDRVEASASEIARMALSEAERSLRAGRDAAAIRALGSFPEGYATTEAARKVKTRVQEIERSIDIFYAREMQACESLLREGSAAKARTRLLGLASRVTTAGERGPDYVRPSFRPEMERLSRRISEQDRLAKKRESETPSSGRPPASRPPGAAAPAVPPEAADPSPAPAVRPPSRAARPLRPKTKKASAAARRKLPVPSPAAQKRADKTVREVFEADYARKSVPFRIRLAQKLLQQAKKPGEEPAVRYSLLRESMDVAARVGEAKLALKAAQELAGVFEVDPVEMKLDVLATAGRQATSTAQRVAVLEAYLTMAEASLKKDELAAARKAASAASNVARRVKLSDLSLRASSLTRRISSIRREQEKAVRATETLGRTPDDPAANLTVGRYECIYRGRWEKGLPFLARGAHQGMREAAVKDLARPPGAVARVSVGDTWWDLARKENEPARSGLRARAAGWYALALPDIGGLAQVRLRKRLEQVPAWDRVRPGPARGTGPKVAVGIQVGLAGYWTFDDGVGKKAADASGGGHEGELRNGASWTPGKRGGALALDGAGDFVIVPHAPGLDLGSASFTISVWIKLSGKSPGRIVTKLNTGQAAGWSFDVNMGLSARAKPGYLRIRVTDTNDVTVDHSVDAGLRTGEWTHVAVIADRKAATLRFFARGKQVGSSKKIGSLTGRIENRGDISLGVVPSLMHHYFAGALDDLRIYRRALSAGDIAGLAGGK